MLIRATTPLLGLLISCGQEPLDFRTIQEPTKPVKEIFIDQAFQELYQKYNTNIGYNPYNVTAEFGEVQKPAVATCTAYSNGDRVIAVDRAYWDQVSIEAKETLMFHELGHCVQNLKHTRENKTAVNSKGEYSQVPASIMFPSQFESFWYYVKYREEYWQELRDQGIKSE